MGTDLETSEYLDTVSNVLVDWLRGVGNTAVNFLIKLGLALLILFIVMKILKKFLNFLKARMEKRNVDPAIRIFTISLIKYAVIIFMVVEIVQMLDIVKASSIAALIASAGVGISLAMQGTLSNFAGGILLLVLRPFRIGDYIVVPNSTAEGTVTKIEMYYTTLRTVDNEFVSIPNSELTNHQVTRYAEGEQRKLINRVTIAYSADLHLAKEILGRLIHEDKRYLRLQTVFVDELADSGVVLGCSGMVRADQYRIISWEMNERIKLAFDEAGIEIPFNQMDVHIIPESKNGEKE